MNYEVLETCEIVKDLKTTSLQTLVEISQNVTSPFAITCDL